MRPGRASARAAIRSLRCARVPQSRSRLALRTLDLCRTPKGPCPAKGLPCHRRPGRIAQSCRPRRIRGRADVTSGPPGEDQWSRWAAGRIQRRVAGLLRSRPRRPGRCAAPRTAVAVGSANIGPLPHTKGPCTRRNEHDADVKASFSYQPGPDDGCQPKRRFRMIWMRSTAGILCMGIALALAAARDNTALEEGVAKFQRGDFAGAAQALGRSAEACCNGNGAARTDRKIRATPSS
jgi:hypothetical protein